MKYQPRFSRTVGKGAKQISVQKLKVSGKVMKCESMIGGCYCWYWRKNVGTKSWQEKKKGKGMVKTAAIYCIRTLFLTSLVWSPSFFTPPKKGSKVILKTGQSVLKSSTKFPLETPLNKSHRQVERENNSGIILHQHQDIS